MSELVHRGILDPNATGQEWLLAYCHRLREVAAGRMSAELGGLDLVQERAALARAQRESVEIKNGVLRQEYAPIELLSRVLATASQAVADRIDSVPSALKKACPGLDDDAYRAIESVLVAARNEWARATAELVDAELAEMDEIDTDDEVLDA
ncbi:MAG TPA: hypothetical protein PK177_09745 [Burkholderiaceae bacterium]|nr:hypothetical protein [Burkholderiaceae bacterium]